MILRVFIAIAISFNVFANANGELGTGSKEMKVLSLLGFTFNYENKIELNPGKVKAKLFSNEKFNFGLNLGIEEGRKKNKTK